MTLIRRLAYDLTGLPPAPEDVDAFLADRAPGAYERLVDRLLASPHYGENWGRHWLDLVRYGETNGYERDSAKPVRLAVSRLCDRRVQPGQAVRPVHPRATGRRRARPGSAEALIATGFYRLGIWDDEPADRALARYDGLDGIVSTTGQVFLGITINCARCHDHKVDPIPQKDYYRLLAFFQDSPIQRQEPEEGQPTGRGPRSRSCVSPSGTGPRRTSCCAAIRRCPATEVEPGVPGGAGRWLVRHSSADRGKRLAAGGLADRPAKPADGPGAGQPPLAIPLRPRHRAHAQRFRQAGRVADAPRTARLARRGARRRRLEDEARCTG